MIQYRRLKSSAIVVLVHFHFLLRRNLEKFNAILVTFCLPLCITTWVSRLTNPSASSLRSFGSTSSRPMSKFLSSTYLYMKTYLYNKLTFFRFFKYFSKLSKIVGNVRIVQKPFQKHFDDNKNIVEDRWTSSCCVRINASVVKKWQNYRLDIDAKNAQKP